MALLSGIISKELPVKLIEKRRNIMIESFGYELIKKEGYEEGLQKGFQQGIQQGIEKGLQKGVKKGLLEGSREMVLEVLTEKFGSVPQDVERRIRSINSRRRLKDLLRQAVRASTIEEFARLLS
jgi:flagellar biosynthesis/type III secretory pathway protein FliH